MSRPVLMAVDDDGPVLAAVERDLRDRYAEHYQVITASSGDQALDLLRRLRLRDDTVALLLVDQRMPGMSGTEFLAASRELYPDAKRVLLPLRLGVHRATLSRQRRPASDILWA